MAVTNNLKENTGHLKRGPAINRSKNKIVIQLYEGPKTLIFQTTLNIGLSLAFPTIYNATKTNVQYQKLTAKCSTADPITRMLERERDALYGVPVAF